MIRVSAGTAGLMGMSHCLQTAPPTTAYLMVGEKCTNNCSFCAQAWGSSRGSSFLSRITWPEYPLPEVLEGLSAAYTENALKRVCIQVVRRSDSLKEVTGLICLIKDTVPEIPLSVSISLDSLEAVAEILGAGADSVNISLDGASPSVFEDMKQRPWNKVWALLTQAARSFPRRITTHIIAGLGEKEIDLAKTLQKCKDLGINTGLFAFTPIKGTPMEGKPQPHLASYRKLQAAAYLIKHNYAREEQFSYDSKGSITSLGITGENLGKILSSGKAFETSGCLGCNRPFYNESPRQTPYNYPRPLTKKETEQAIKEVFSNSVSSQRKEDISGENRISPGRHDMAAADPSAGPRGLQHGC